MTRRDKVWCLVFTGFWLAVIVLWGFLVKGYPMP